MPIYEFYCQTCHTVFNFFSGRIDTTGQPACPRCGRAELPRRPSRFATLKHSGEDQQPDPFADFDDSKLEGAMEALMQEAGGLENEEDPRAMAHLMRRFTDLSGLEMGDRMADFVSRLESGEDPDRLEQEMDGSMEDENYEDFFKLKKAIQDRRKHPHLDEELYFL